MQTFVKDKFNVILDKTIKGTANVISIGPPCKNDNGLFTYGFLALKPSLIDVIDDIVVFLGL